MLDELSIAAPAMACVGVTPTGSPATARNPIDVLLIEPDPDCADALSSILAGLPRIDRVIVVEDAREAARALAGAEVPPTIIMVDDQPGSCAILGTIDVVSEYAPEAALILLCVYPQCVDQRVRDRVRLCVSKDVTRADLARVVDEII